MSSNINDCFDNTVIDKTRFAHDTEEESWKKQEEILKNL